MTGSRGGPAGGSTGGSAGGAFGLARAATDGTCPCGGFPVPGTSYAACCGRFHSGAEAASTAEALMRSRYCAFAVGDEDYLLRTWHARTRPAGLRLEPRHAWVGLEVLAVTGGGVDEQEGVVVYRALSRGYDGSEHVLLEESRFARRGGRWVYVDGVVDPAST